MTIEKITWHRLEPVARSRQISAGVAARIHDPLWLLGRQWQFGEWQGEDAGSPVTVRVETSSAPLTRWRAGDSGPGQPYDPAAAPLEAQVEREPRDEPGFRDAADSGVHFLRLLREAGAGDASAVFIEAYPLAIPEGAAEFGSVFAGRVPDGNALAGALRAPGLPVTVPDGLAATVRAAADAYLAWYDAEIMPAGAGASWVTPRLEYRFAVAGEIRDGEVVLRSESYLGGTLDWHDVSATGGQSLGATGAAPTSQVATVLATPVRYRGAPADRFWAFEDAAVNLAALDAAPDDLGRLALVEFATVFGNDWYLMPVESPYGTLNDVVSVLVRDTFGEALLLRHTSQASAGRFRMFDVGHTTPLLFLPPVVAESLTGEPLEEVLFLRDEMANLAWAVEHVVEGADGRPRRRAEEPPPPPDPPAGPAGLRYLAQTTIPAHWIPFLPVHDETRRGVRLHRGAMLAYGDQPPTPVAPVGQILEPDRPLALYEEEIPRSGVRVSRVPALCRWVNGGVYAWTGRRVNAGRGEGSSGLSFDVARP